MELAALAELTGPAATNSAAAGSNAASAASRRASRVRTMNERPMASPSSASSAGPVRSGGVPDLASRQGLQVVHRRSEPHREGVVTHFTFQPTALTASALTRSGGP